jgi:hypothetical protein
LRGDDAARGERTASGPRGAGTNGRPQSRGVRTDAQSRTARSDDGAGAGGRSSPRGARTDAAGNGGRTPARGPRTEGAGTPRAPFKRNGSGRS